MAELQIREKAGEHAEHGVEYCQECYCNGCHPVESSYLVRGEDKSKEGGRGGIRTRFHSSQCSFPQQPLQRPLKPPVPAVLTERVTGPSSIPARHMDSHGSLWVSDFW